MATVKELREALATRVTEIKSFTDNMKIEDGNVTVSTEDKARVQKLMGEASELKGLLAATDLEAEVKSWADAESQSAAMHAAASTSTTRAPMTVGSAFTNSAEYKAMMERGSGHTDRAFELATFDVSGVQVKDVYSDLGAHDVNVGLGTRVQFDPMQPRAQRRMRVRDLFPAAATAANTIDFFKMLGFTTNNGAGNAAPVAQRSGGSWVQAPKSSLTTVADTAIVRTVAHYTEAHKNTLADVPQLRSVIDNELLYGLALEEDYQLLKGTGTGEDLRGLLNTEDIQLFTGANGELRADSLRKAATLSMLANYPSTGYVVNPMDWEAIELEKATTGDGHYMFVTNIAVGMEARAWRQPVVETPAMDEGTFLTGAFGTAVQIYDRQKATVSVSEHNGVNFTAGVITIMVDERLTLVVKRPEAVIRGTFAVA